MLVAVDDVNGFLEPESGTHGFDLKLLPPGKLTLVNHFLELIDGRKALVCTVHTTSPR